MTSKSIVKQLLVTSVFFLCVFEPVYSISCYQCNSTDHNDPFQCGEYMTSDIDIEPVSCAAVYNAQYCIKQTGRLEVRAIYCFQCSSTKNISCADNLISEGDIKAESCDHVFEANYCIKTTGIHEGGLGTRRYCSSLDLGNYCNFIKQPGDDLEYRSCVYTCSSDGCNKVGILKSIDFMIYTLAGFSVLYVLFCN